MCNKGSCCLIIVLAVTALAVFIAIKCFGGSSLDATISGNSTFPDGSYMIPVKSLEAGPPEHAPLLLDIPMLNRLGLKVDNSSLVAETNRLSYFFVRLPPDIDGSARNKRDVSSNDENSIGIRFGASALLHVIPLARAMTPNSGLSFVGALTDNSRIYQLEVRTGNAMYWKPYLVSNKGTASPAKFNNKLPVACGSQCNANAGSACAKPCSMCDGQQVAGADTPVAIRYQMDTNSAKNLRFVYETFQVKDRIIVSYDGQTLFDSGCVGTLGQKQAPISYKGNSMEVRVDVEPNCDGTSQTQWHFTLPCPSSQTTSSSNDDESTSVSHFSPPVPDCERCKRYRCLDDSLAHCGPKGYLKNYGLYFCTHLDYYDQFDAKGQAFIECARPRLLDFLENYLKQSQNGNVNCKDVHQKAFDSHLQVYIDCGFCSAFSSNTKVFMKVLYQSLVGHKASGDAWAQVRSMVLKCGHKYHQDLCNNYPNVPSSQHVATMNKKKVCIWSSVLIAILVIAAAVTVTLVLVLRKHEKHAPSLDTVISDNSTFPNGSYTIPVDSLKSGLPEQAPLFVDISMLNELGLRVDNSSLVAETNRLSYFFVRLPPDNTTNLRNKRQLEDDGKGIGVRFGNSDKIHVIPLELSTTKNSGLSLIGEMSDNSQVYQLEVRMGNAMCANADDGTCLLVDWTPYFVSNENTASKAGFSDELPVACGSQCNADANSACATSCSMCDGQQVAGADTPVTRRYKMNKTSATDLQFVYETFQVKDRIVVSYEGQHIFDSDCVGTNGEKKAPINYKGKSVEVRVDVEPNCEGTTGTAWYFTLPCDDCEKCKKYKCLDDSLAHCGPKGYLIDYALYFCNRYYDYYSGFDASGQNFIDCVRPRLLDFLENYLKARIKWKS
ncbi:hypothetical protein M3Y97_00657700 [Aphelenchoides bicaudatus]|nr:hypothetical protein M3Y97_00657700 [Aphelenchoides bicaudatus]